MIPNFVIFGPTHSGKSTLTGYLLVKKDPQHTEAFTRFKNEYKHEKKFLTEKKYSWYIDRAPIERQKSKESGQKKKGSSVLMHPWPLYIDNNLSFNLIDTPGMDSATREKIRGIFWGDIGIFVAECNELSEDIFKDKENSIRDYLNPLILWSKMGKKSPKLIILLSKMDNVLSKLDNTPFSKEKFDIAKNKLELICKEIGLLSIHIIPGCINIEEEIDHNIITSSNEMKWYKGPTLFEVMNTYSSDIQQKNEIKKQLLLTLENYTKTVKGIGQVVGGKILSGELKVADAVKIVPVEYNGKVESLHAKVRSISVQRGNPINVACEGSIIGIALSDELVNNRRSQLSECKFFKTSLLIHDKIPVDMGNLLHLRILPQDNRIFNLLEPLHIIWHGRMVAANIVSIKSKDSNVDIWICLRSDVAAIPRNENNSFCFTNFILKFNQDIIRTTMIEIGFADNLEFELAPPIVDIKNIQSYFISYPFEIFGNNIKFKNFLTTAQLIGNIKRIQRFENEKCKGTHPILDTLTIKIK